MLFEVDVVFLEGFFDFWDFLEFLLFFSLLFVFVLLQENFLVIVWEIFLCLFVVILFCLRFLFCNMLFCNWCLRFELMNFI